MRRRRPSDGTRTAGVLTSLCFWSIASSGEPMHELGTVVDRLRLFLRRKSFDDQFAIRRPFEPMLGRLVSCRTGIALRGRSEPMDGDRDAFLRRAFMHFVPRVGGQCFARHSFERRPHFCVGLEHRGIMTPLANEDDVGGQGKLSPRLSHAQCRVRPVSRCRSACEAACPS
jgi:hypothetical protein